ncbi:MAG: SAM-dependent methyltransferase [Natronosporangium sp.]
MSDRPGSPAQRHPRSAAYDPAWVRSLDMGPHPLWQLEHLLRDIPLQPGMRVLDLGCGKGATSVFLVREFGVSVTACDLLVPAEELRGHLREAGIVDDVVVLHANARDLPLPNDSFDAIVSIDAFEYFGTDVQLLPGLLRVLRPGGQIGMSTPALRVDPYQQPPPSYVTEVVGWEAAAWHAPEWWERHWRLSGLVTDVRARMHPTGREDWLAWCAALDAGDHSPVAQMLQQDHDNLLGFALVTATKI